MFSSNSKSSPWDDLCECLNRFLLDCVARNNGNIDNLEIEAKFGLIIDKSTNERIQLPVLSECVINADDWTCFVSDMPTSFHKYFNEQLNKMFADRSLGWKYKHTKTLDQIHSNGLRVTVDPETNGLLKAQKKKKLAHLAIFQPNFPMDLRISVSTEDEIPVKEIDVPALPHSVTRKKDRLAYEDSTGFLSIDLTQVTQNDSNGRQVKHELEVEVKRPRDLIQSPENLKLFLDSIRELYRLG